MTRQDELAVEQGHFDRAMRAFKQNPTPSMSTVLKKISGRITYLRRCIRKEGSR